MLHCFEAIPQERGVKLRVCVPVEQRGAGGVESISVASKRLDTMTATLRRLEVEEGHKSRCRS